MAARKFKRLFFDIETSPNLVYSWRIGNKIHIDYENIVEERKIICVCWKWDGTRAVESLMWDQAHDDKSLLEQFIPILNTADESIAHNGDRFDLPWLRTRCLIHRLPCFPYYTSTDTLKLARRGYYFNCARLDYLTKLLCGHGKIKTTFDLWKECLASNSKALAKMVRYCKTDVRRLAELYHLFTQYAYPTTNHAVLAGGNKWECPHCTATAKFIYLVKTRVTPLGTQRRQMQCQKCGRYFTIANNTYGHLLKARLGLEAL